MADVLTVRLVVLLSLAVGFAWVLAHQVLGGRHRAALVALAVPALALGWQEGSDWLLRAQYSAAVSEQVGRPVRVDCQRLTGAWVDPTAELGFVRFGPDGTPDDVARLEYDACRRLNAWMRSDRQDPPLEQVVAVHVLAHEAEHLAGELNEGVAECRSLQRTAALAERLGASRDQARELAVTYVRQVYPSMPEAYRSPACHPGGSLDLAPDDPAWP